MARWTLLLLLEIERVISHQGPTLRGCTFALTLQATSMGTPKGALE